MNPANPVPMKDIHEPFDAKMGEGLTLKKAIEVSIDNDRKADEEAERQKRTAIEIIDAIYAALEVKTYHPVSHISEASGVDWRTTKRYLDLIEFIQSKQKGSWLRCIIPGDDYPIYARERKR